MTEKFSDLAAARMRKLARSGKLKIGFQCCFCSQSIETIEHDPCALHLVTRYNQPKDKQREQTVFCHIDCLLQHTQKAIDMDHLSDNLKY